MAQYKLSFYYYYYYYYHLCDLDLGAMTLKLNRDIDILKMYLQLKMKLLGQAIRKIMSGLEKYKNSSQGQRSRSNVINFQQLLAFTMRHILTKLHQFPTSSFRDFLRTDIQTHRRQKKQYLLAA